MKNIVKYALVLALALPITSCNRDEEPQVVNGTNGQNGKSILSGNGVPDVNLGSDGDFYLDKNTMNLYGPKTTNGWGNPVSLKGSDGQKGANGSKIHSGTTAPDIAVGVEGDWYIDTQNRILYGPKTNNGWGTGIALGTNSISMRGDYLISKDGKTLLKWFNPETEEKIDMEADIDLRNVTKISKGVFAKPVYILPGRKTYKEEGLVKEIKFAERLKEIGAEAFKRNQLTSIDIPNSVVSIGDSAFSYNKLQSITISNSLKEIKKGVFRYNQLTAVTIPNSVKIIEYGAFSGNKLTSVVIPNSVTSIGIGAFHGNQLTTITIPSSVKSIGYGAFYYNKLVAVVVENVIPPTMVNTYRAIGYQGIFDNKNKPPKIYVPAGSVDVYKNTEGWSAYANYIEAIQ